ncbi:MAG TPA: endonuclease/exonuclease/phosphatase family protein [Chthoniobacteraceae bacterium]|nr:endonuclease/exonuclease/phosphatase family protein [Chthoniobacteraceae bacterium]
MTYNVHSCVGTDGDRSLARIAQVISDARADVVALQELDHQRVRSQLTHQAEALARELSMDFHFHPALRIADEEYGDAILSRHALEMIHAAELPGVAPRWCREARGALWVTLPAEGTAWQIINTHFGLGRAERFDQARALLGDDWIRAAEMRGPVIVCGDFNSQAGGRVQRLLASRLKDAQGTRHRSTFPSRFPLLCLDYIFVGRGVRVNSVEIVRNSLTRVASDHLPLVADVEMEPITITRAEPAGAVPLRASAG